MGKTVCKQKVSERERVKCVHISSCETGVWWDNFFRFHSYFSKWIHKNKKEQKREKKSDKRILKYQKREEKRKNKRRINSYTNFQL